MSKSFVGECSGFAANGMELSCEIREGVVKVGGRGWLPYWGMEEQCLLHGENGELVLFSVALCCLEQVVAGINPTLTAGRVHSLSEGSSEPGSRAIPRGDGV